MSRRAEQRRQRQRSAAAELFCNGRCRRCIRTESRSAGRVGSAAAEWTGGLVVERRARRSAVSLVLLCPV